MLLSEGQMSDYKGTALMINALPRAKALLADRGYDADWFRHALAERGIAACIPSKTNRKTPIPHDTGLYRQRHEVENMFGELKPVLSLPKGTGDASTPVTTDAHTHWLRRPSGHVRHLHRRNRHLLAAAMRPEPGCLVPACDGFVGRYVHQALISRARRWLRMAFGTSAP